MCGAPIIFVQGMSDNNYKSAEHLITMFAGAEHR